MCGGGLQFERLMMKQFQGLWQDTMLIWLRLRMRNLSNRCCWAQLVEYVWISWATVCEVASLLRRDLRYYYAWRRLKDDCCACVYWLALLATCSWQCTNDLESFRLKKLRTSLWLSRVLCAQLATCRRAEEHRMEEVGENRTHPRIENQYIESAELTDCQSKV